MLKERARIVASVLLAIDLVGVALAFLLAYWLRDTALPDLGLRPRHLYPLRLYLPLLPLVLGIWGVLLSRLGAYKSHRTISLIDAEMGTAMFLPPASTGELREMTMTSLEEVHSRGGPLLAVGAMSDAERQHVDACILTPGRHEIEDAMLQLLASQYLSYHTARVLGRDIDRPRALAKSVTVP